MLGYTLRLKLLKRLFVIFRSSHPIYINTINNQCTRKRSFPFRISSVSCGFGHIYWILNGKLQFFVQWIHYITLWHVTSLTYKIWGVYLLGGLNKRGKLFDKTTREIFVHMFSRCWWKAQSDPSQTSKMELYLR